MSHKMHIKESYEKDFIIAIISIIAILIIVFTVSSYLQNSGSTALGQDYAGQAYNLEPKAPPAKTYIYSDPTPYYSYMKHQKPATTG